MRIFKIAFSFLLIIVSTTLLWFPTSGTAEASIDEAAVIYYYITLHTPHQSPALSYNLAQTTVQAAYNSGLPAAVLVAVQQVESGFHVTATSNKDAVGPMQVHFPTWGPALGLSQKSKLFLYVPSVNVNSGASILTSYLTAENGNLLKALYRYLGLPDEKVARMSGGKRDAAQKQRLAYAKSIAYAYASYIRFWQRIIRMGA